MYLNNLAAKAAATLALGIVATAPAAAQSLSSSYIPSFSFADSTQKQTWHTVLLVSAVVAGIGLISGDGTLTIIGGAGVVVSLIESEPSRFRTQSFRHGMDLFKSGPLSFGINPFGSMGLSPGFAGMRPGAYMQLSFKF